MGKVLASLEVGSNAQAFSLTARFEWVRPGSIYFPGTRLSQQAPASPAFGISAQLFLELGASLAHVDFAPVASDPRAQLLRARKIVEQLVAQGRLPGRDGDMIRQIDLRLAVLGSR